MSLELFPSEVVALLGPNGAGKTTLLKIMAGLIPVAPHDGQLRYMGRDFHQFTTATRAQSVAYVSSHLRAEFPLTAYETVMMGRLSHGMHFLRGASEADHDLVHSAMEQCHCWRLRDRDIHTLSGGERQLVALARALAQGAKVLLLDESLSGMDLNHQIEIGKLLRALASEGLAIVLVAHDVNLASEWVDNCLLLYRGERVGYGRTGDVLTVESLKKLYPGAEFTLGRNPVTGAPKVFFGRGEG